MPRRTPPSLPARRWSRLPLVLAALGLVQVLALWRQGYSQAWFTGAGLSEARTPRDPMELGGLRWDPAPYTSATSLAPLRAFVRARCPGLGAVGTGNCLSDLFGQAFRHGAPPVEFFAPGYAPAAALAEHLGGAPGHCVTRSGLIAAALLASGFPARVVQFLPETGNGHNVVEAWEPASGWTLIDPTYRLQVTGAAGLSAAAALAEPQVAQWRVNAAVRPVMNLRDQPVAEAIAIGRHLATGRIIYLDPWLYTRVGHKAAPPPFQARFVLVGGRTLDLGLGQPLLQAGILLCLAGLVVSLFGAGATVEAPAGAIVPLVTKPALTIPRPEVIAAERAEALVASRSADG
jgi:hypothetical protein